MSRILIAGGMMAMAFAAVAMPTKKELLKVQSLVNEATAADLRAMKEGKRSIGEVADRHAELAEMAEDDAQRYLLLQAAFKLYYRGGEYDAAARMLEKMKRDIVAVPPELIVEIVGKEIRQANNERASRVMAIFRKAQRLAGETMKIALPENESMELVRVRPGKFPMLIDGKGNTRMTTITRPYWIGKYPITLGQWHAVMGKIMVSASCEAYKDHRVDCQEEIMERLGRNLAIARSSLHMEEFGEKLTKLIKDQLPEGYVARLPTNAEWEYAVRGKGDDIYSELVGSKIEDSRQDEIREGLNGGKDVMAAETAKIMEVGVDYTNRNYMVRHLYYVGRSTNSWGICDFFRRGEFTLDRISLKDITCSWGRSGKVVQAGPCNSWPLPKGNVDPFQYVGGYVWESCVLVRGWLNGMNYCNSNWPHAFVRIAIGPDYVGEWKAKRE